MELNKIADYLDEKLKAKRFKDDGNSNGLIIKGKNEVNKIAVATNTSFESINKTLEQNGDMLVVHHPTWEWADQENREKKLKTLRKNDISLYAAHDSMDCIPVIGIGDVLAKKLGIEVEGRSADWNIMPWYKKDDDKRVDNIYVGVYGSLRNGMSFENFCDLVEKTLGCKIRSWENNDKKVKKIGIIPGAGLESMWVREAKKLGCDTYISGQDKLFASIYAKEVGINLILATHHGTEALGMRELKKIIQGDLGIETVYINEENMG